MRSSLAIAENPGSDSAYQTVRLGTVAASGSRLTRRRSLMRHRSYRWRHSPAYCWPDQERKEPAERTVRRCAVGYLGPLRDNFQYMVEHNVRKRHRADIREPLAWFASGHHELRYRSAVRLHRARSSRNKRPWPLDPFQRRIPGRPILDIGIKSPDGLWRSARYFTVFDNLHNQRAFIQYDMRAY